MEMGIRFVFLGETIEGLDWNVFFFSFLFFISHSACGEINGLDCGVYINGPNILLTG